MIMKSVALLSTEPSSDAAALPDRAERFRALFDAHVDFVARYLRRLGVPEKAVEDAAQKVFLIASTKLDDVRPGSERAFLVGTAQRVASDVRDALSRRREVPYDMPEREDERALADELVDQKRARELLDRVLDTLPDELRAVFVLFELEGLTIDEAAQALGAPRGTASSRLTRARELFQAEVKRRTAPRPLKGATR
jgi:RNA polymerase sigma-70 factor, ECF subfamily